MDLSFLKNTRIIFFDIETTGLSKMKCFVREFGTAEYIDGLPTKGHGSILCSGGVCPIQALRVHGITDEQVADKPSFAKYASAVAKGFSKGPDENRRIILGGHNVIKFDIPFVSHVMAQNGHPLVGSTEEGEVEVIDTLPLARKNLSLPNNKLGTICEALGIPYGAHRAHGDAQSSWAVFLKIVELSGNSNLSDYISKV